MLAIFVMLGLDPAGHPPSNLLPLDSGLTVAGDIERGCAAPMAAASTC
jgi:hypothetical protein